jgi:hypothetical protein
MRIACSSSLDPSTTVLFPFNHYEVLNDNGCDLDLQLFHTSNEGKSLGGQLSFQGDVNTLNMSSEYHH